MFMHTRKKIFIAAAICFAGVIGGVHVANAAVRINEVAWMGTPALSTGEWVELMNDADTPVSLLGWRLRASDGSPDVLLSGIVSPSGYYLIERKTDGVVPDVPADLVASFGVGLSNAGETLELQNASGTVIDTVNGGKNWMNIGGDNTTKQTAQRLSDANDWVTGMPTPRAQNVRPAPPQETTKVTTAPPTQAVPLSDKKTAVQKLGSTLKQSDTASGGTTTVLWKSETAQVGASDFFGERDAKWVFLFTGILLSVCAGIIIIRSAQREPAPSEEYSIVEDIIEGVDD